MSRYVLASFPTQTVPAARGGTVTVHGFTIKLELRKDGTWHFVHGYHFTPEARCLFPASGGGRYQETKTTRWFILYDSSGTQEVMVMRGVENSQGPALALPRGNGYLLKNGQWRPAAEGMPKTWLGFMGKASLGAGYGREAGLGAIFSTSTNQAIIFVVKSSRLGAMAGFSGGMAFVMATGIEQAGDVHGMKSDGADWTLSIGTKASAVLKSQRLITVFKRFEHVLEGVDDVIRRLKDSDLTRELHTVGKNVYGGYLVDTDEKGISAFDIPLMGAGAEIGIFYAWSSYEVVGSHTW